MLTLVEGPKTEITQSSTFVRVIKIASFVGVASIALHHLVDLFGDKSDTNLENNHINILEKRRRPICQFTYGSASKREVLHLLHSDHGVFVEPESVKGKSNERLPGSTSETRAEKKEDALNKRIALGLARHWIFVKVDRFNRSKRLKHLLDVLRCEREGEGANVQTVVRDRCIGVSV